MGDAVEILKKSIAAFDASLRQLLDRHSCDADDHLRLSKFIHGCRCSCTANMDWRSVALMVLALALALIPRRSLSSGRYKLGRQSLRNGLTVTLDGPNLS